MCLVGKPEVYSYNYPPKKIEFIENLFRDKRYFDAISEAGKLNFERSSIRLKFFINSCYFLGEQYHTVISNLEEASFNGILGFEMKELLSFSYINTGRYDLSYKNALAIDYNSVHSAELKRKLFRMRILPAVKSYRTEIIKQEIKDASKYLGGDQYYISLKDELLEFTHLRRKSPFMSSLSSSLVPGSGQIYCGRIADGIISFLSVASTFAGGLYLKEKGMDGYSNTLFFFSGLFYAGNIYGAYNSAHNYNKTGLMKMEKNIINSAGLYSPERDINLREILK